MHNRRTYPNLLRLFDELGVATQESEMSMSVRCEGCGLEYAGARGPAGLLARPRNALNGPYLRMLAQVPRFHRAARRLLDGNAADQALTLGEFLAREGFGPYFRAHFMTPVVSAVWSCDAEETARVWRLYLVGGALAFEQRRMGVDQILGVRPTAEGVSGMPATPGEWYERLDRP